MLNIPESAVSAIAVAVGFALVTALHIVAGELIPKSLAIFSTDRYARFTALPLVWFYGITAPVMWLFNSVTNGVMKLMGMTIPQNRRYIQRKRSSCLSTKARKAV